MTLETDTPLVSIVVPCRNEAGWIARCLESVFRNEYPEDRLEVLVIDGMSDDETRALVEDIATRHPYVRLLDNPKKITPAALNVGIAAAIDRLHSDPTLCRTLGETGHQVVLNRFNWELESQKLLAVYARILNGKTATASNSKGNDRDVNDNDRHLV